MKSKHFKSFLVIEIVIITILSVLLLFSVRKSYQLVQIIDSVQTKNDALEEQMQEKEDFQYFRNYILFSEDTIAYKDMMVTYFGLNNLPYSIYMADHRDYPYACFEVYNEIVKCLKELEDANLKIKASRMAIDYLKKGAGLKDNSCSFVLAGMYINGDNVPQDTILGKKYLEQAVPKELLEIEYNRIKKFEGSFFLHD